MNENVRVTRKLFVRFHCGIFLQDLHAPSLNKHFMEHFIYILTLKPNTHTHTHILPSKVNFHCIPCPAPPEAKSGMHRLQIQYSFIEHLSCANYYARSEIRKRAINIRSSLDREAKTKTYNFFFHLKNRLCF